MSVSPLKPIVSTTRMTAQQYLQLGEDPPGVRLELVDGEIAVSPSPNLKHAHCLSELSNLLMNHCKARRLGFIVGDLDTLVDDFNVRRPDLLFFPSRRRRDLSDTLTRGVPELAVEIVSPSSVQIDKRDKLAQYARAGIAFYWIADPEQRTLEGYQLQGDAYQPTGKGQGDDTLTLPPFEGLTLPLTDLWWRDEP